MLNKKIKIILFFLNFIIISLLWKNEVKAVYESCGSNGCEPLLGEDYINCPVDCPAPSPLPSGASPLAPYCGNGTCDVINERKCNIDGTELPGHCVQDCGACPAPGYERCSPAGTCPDGRTYWTYCSPSCASASQTCYNTPVCTAWPPSNCNGATCVLPGHDASTICNSGGSGCCCPAANCPGGGGCGQARCGTGGNCYSDCSGCGASPSPGSSPPSSPVPPLICTPVAPVAPVLTSPANASTDIHTATVTLDWQDTNFGQSCPAGGAQQYRVYMDTSSSPNTKVCTTTSATTVCQAPITAVNTVHYWKVCADNSFSVACSPVWSFTPTNVKPDSATGGSPQGNLTTNSLSFMWDHDGVWGTFVNTSNVVLNYSFENADNFWFFYGGFDNVGNSFVIDSTIAKLHSNSLKLNVVAQGAGITPYAVMSQGISSLAGKTISIGGWLRSDGSATAYLGWKNDTDNIVQFVGSGVTSTSWTYVEGTAVLQPGKNYSVRLQSSNPGSSWFDYITVVEDQSANKYFYVDYSTTSGSYNWASPKCSLVGSTAGAYDSCGPFGPSSTVPINWGTTYYWKVRASNNASNFTDTNTYNDSLEWSFTPNHGPWFQVFGGDVYAGGIISSEIPNSTCIAPACQPYLMPTLATQKHGVVVYNNTFSLGSDCGGACIPGNISEDADDWYAQTNLNTTNYDYDWWLGHLANETKTNLNSSNLGTIAADGVYTLDASISDLYGTVAANRKIIILANKANLSVSNNISVPSGSFLMVIGSGNLNFNSSLAGTAAAPAVQGIFIADQIHFGISSVHLFSAGTFVGTNGITLGRDLVGGNNTAPAVTFIYRPDFVINAPASVKKIYLPRWEQVPG